MLNQTCSDNAKLRIAGKAESREKAVGILLGAAAERGPGEWDCEMGLRQRVRMDEEGYLAGKPKVVIGRKIDPEKFARAREFRAKPTAAEAILWSRLRTNRLHGYHFRCQQVISGFIVDFYCHAARLVVEIDGEIHDYQRESDEERDRALRG